MIIRIGCVDGHTYTSDHTPDAEMQKYIDDNNGNVFTGDLAHKRVDTVKQMMEEMSVMFRYDKKNDHQVVSFYINNVNRTFNACHIVWFEYELDNPNDPWNNDD